MELNFALLFGWISFLTLITFATYYLQKQNYYLGFGYYSIFGFIFFTVTYWFTTV